MVSSQSFQLVISAITHRVALNTTCVPAYLSDTVGSTVLPRFFRREFLVQRL